MDGIPIPNINADTEAMTPHARALRKDRIAYAPRAVQLLNYTTMGVNSTSSGSPDVCPMWARGTCGEPDEIKKNTHPKCITALARGQVL